MATIFITGASSGIGRAAALSFAAKGWLVFGSVRKPQDGEALEKEAEALLTMPGAAAKAKGKGKVQAVLMDVADEGSIRAAVQLVAAGCGSGGLNVLCNNAGTAVFGALETTGIETWRSVFETNVYGVASVTRHCLPLLRLAAAAPSSLGQLTKGARVISIGSAAGCISSPMQSVYTASKHALEGLNDCLRVELAPQGIQVVLMQLGAVATAMASKLRTSNAVTPAAADGPQGAPPANAKSAQAADQGTVAALYDGQIKDALDLFESLEGDQSIPMEVVTRALYTAATAARPATRYPVDGQIALMLRMRWAMTDRQWDRFFPWAANMAKKKATKAKKT